MNSKVAAVRRSAVVLSAGTVLVSRWQLVGISRLKLLESCSIRATSGENNLHPFGTVLGHFSTCFLDFIFRFSFCEVWMAA